MFLLASWKSAERLTMRIHHQKNARSRALTVGVEYGYRWRPALISGISPKPNEAAYKGDGITQNKGGHTCATSLMSPRISLRIHHLYPY